MMAGMGKAREPGPGSRVDNPRDVEVTGGLPMSLTAFVGRERELDELRSLFRAGKRLVTLVGTGGIGKTRLALELGRGASDLGWAKVYTVELASLADPALVDGAVLEIGGRRIQPFSAADGGGVLVRDNGSAGPGLRRACPGCGPACGRGASARVSVRSRSGHQPFSA